MIGCSGKLTLILTVAEPANETMTVRYAAYGSNLHPLRLGQRVAKARLLGTGAIDDFALRFHKRGNNDGSGKCNIVQDTGSQVFVAVYEMPDDAIEVLDRHEGTGDGYERFEILSEQFGACMFYIAQESHIDDSIAPFTWYKNLVLAGCRYHAFPNPYIAAIEAVIASPDPDAARQEAHAQLLQQLIQGS